MVLVLSEYKRAILNGASFLQGYIHFVSLFFYLFQTYLLRCRVFDGTFQDYTDVTVTLEPRNLHPPVFDQDEYDVENITEHDNNLPHTLGFVSYGSNEATVTGLLLFLV